MRLLRRQAGKLTVRFNVSKVVFNERLVLKHVFKGIQGSRAPSGVKAKVLAKVKKVFDAKKRKMIDEILIHPISKEITAGPKAVHTANMLDYAGSRTGNLHAWFGFNKGGAQVIGELVTLFVAGTRLIKKPKRTLKSKVLTYSFDIKVPSQNAILAATQTPWGISWAHASETGMDNLELFLYSATGQYPISKSGGGYKRTAKKGEGRSMTPPSRSGYAIMVKPERAPYSNRDFTPRQYLSPILQKFREAITNPRAQAR
jgi:hypothetical protein